MPAAGGLRSPLVGSEPLVEVSALLLVVEDNAVNQKVAAAMLSKLGYRSEIVANGEAAVDAVGHARYAAVLMDCQMPGMDGYEASAEIRRREGEGDGDRVPIIAMTAGAMTGARERCLAAGMDDYISKPVNLEELSQVLQRWVDPSRAGPRGTGTSAAPPGEAQLSGDPVLDPIMVAELHALDDSAGDAGMMTSLVRRFIENGRTRVAELHEAASSGDDARTGSAAHSLKGSSATLAAHRLAEVCRQLESGAAAGDRTAVAALLQHLDEQFAAAEHALGVEFPGGERSS